MLRLARKRQKKLRHVLPAYRRREVAALKAVDSQRLQFVEFLKAIYAFGNTAAAGQLAVEDKASDQRQRVRIVLHIVDDAHIQLVSAESHRAHRKHYAALREAVIKHDREAALLQAGDIFGDFAVTVEVGIFSKLQHQPLRPVRLTQLLARGFHHAKQVLVTGDGGGNIHGEITLAGMLINILHRFLKDKRGEHQPGIFRAYLR